MNTRAAIDDSPCPTALSVAFNQDFSCFSVALENGFRVYSAPACECLKARDLGQGLGCAEMLGKMNYLALVGGGKSPKYAQNKVIIWDESKHKAVVTLELRTPVQRIRLTRSYIVAVLLNRVHLYKFSSPPEKIKEFETSNNPFGLCCLGNYILVFPGRTPGQVQVVELATRNVSIIPAHSSALRALSLSPDGTIIATASEQGTLIRLWSVGSCARLGEFRRGIDAATIFSIALSPSNAFLAVTSDKGTLHIFDLPGPRNSTSSSDPSTPRRPSSISSDFSGALESGNGAADPQASGSKWGLLGKIPGLPNLFSDTYSSAKTSFEIGEEPELWATHTKRNINTAAVAGSSSAAPGAKTLNWNTPIQGVAGGRPPKGVVGWLNDYELLIIGAGQDARWERFRIGLADDGKRFVIRDAWKKIMER
ncbi:putative phosphatidylinositol 3,5-bisphosphate-binding protein [Phyllosticta citriasiana]|uniref:Phosphatidylinositol 3,5-bisphosphate-binding protein n=1 Tax=Phyllosticta citriasiana TaxID=595635 RepID=A0ABR1KJ04_9PEZI